FAVVSDFEYTLPPELIAQEPLGDRAASRMLRLDRRTGEVTDGLFRNLPDLLRSDDLLVINNTRVFPARLYGHRGGAKAQPVSARNPASREFLQGKIEILLTRQVSAEPNEWECLVRPGRKIVVGERLYFGTSPLGRTFLSDQLAAEVVGRGEF